MSLFAVGLNHVSAPLEVREKVVFTPEMLVDALRDLVSAGRAKEAAILSTCNRTEVYFEAHAPAPIASWLAGFHGVPERSLAPHCYTLPRDEAVTHAFRVASGLDSMVLGEPQILGQMKHAIRSAESAGSLGLVLNRLFQRTFAVAKDVRTWTDIGTASVSMAAASVKLAERIFPSLSDRRFLFVGAGEMIELAANHFLPSSARACSRVSYGGAGTHTCSLRISAYHATWRQRLPASMTFSCTRSMTCRASSTKTSRSDAKRLCLPNR